MVVWCDCVGDLQWRRDPLPCGGPTLPHPAAGRRAETRETSHCSLCHRDVSIHSEFSIYCMQWVLLSSKPHLCIRQYCLCVTLPCGSSYTLKASGNLGRRARAACHLIEWIDCTHFPGHYPHTVRNWCLSVGGRIQRRGQLSHNCPPLWRGYWHPFLATLSLVWCYWIPFKKRSSLVSVYS